MSIAAGLPVTPDVRIVDDPSPNAFAAGIRPQTSYIGVTTGLLRVMPKRELEAVLGHEISHVRNRDTYLMTMATIFAGVIALIADVGFRMLVYGGGRSRRGGALVLVVAVVGLLLAPYAALLLRMSLLAAPRVPGGPRIRGASQRSRGHGARAAQAAELDTTTMAYADASVAHLWVESPTSRVESEQAQVSWRFRACSTLIRRSTQRIAALEESGGFRLPETLPPDRAVRV